MIDLFGKKPLDLTNVTCHSGGAQGADTAWENIGAEFGVTTKAYSYKTSFHKSLNSLLFNIPKSSLWKMSQKR